jgi:hypothetical protein
LVLPFIAYTLFNKIRDKGKIVSTVREGVGGKREGVGVREWGKGVEVT